MDEIIQRYARTLIQIGGMEVVTADDYARILQKFLQEVDALRQSSWGGDAEQRAENVRRELEKGHVMYSPLPKPKYS